MDNKKAISPIGSWGWSDQEISSVLRCDPSPSSVRFCGSPFDSPVTREPIFCLDLNSAYCRSL